MENKFVCGSNLPSESEVTFTKDDYELAFIRKNSYQKLLDANTSTFMIRYSKNIDEPGKNYKQTLLTKSFECYFESKELKKTSEQIYTYMLGQYNENKDSYDKFVNTYKDGIVYGIKEHTEDLTKHSFNGLCFEGKVELRDFNNAINSANYPILNKDDITSAIIFSDTDKGEDTFNTNNIQIYKWEECIQIIYDIDRHHIKTSMGKEHLLDFRIEFPILNNGKLSLRELQVIISLLEERFPNDSFIAKVLEELHIFGEKIKDNIEVTQDDDILSPMTLFNTNFAKIKKDVEANLDAYFEEAEKQFKAASSNENNKTKRLELK